MSIDKKIAELLEESKKLQEQEQLDEEVALDEEQLDELSTGALARYADKAKKSAHGNNMMGALSHEAGDKKSADEYNAKASKREAGAKKATDTIKKRLPMRFEETESELDEEQLEELKIDVSEDVAALVNGEELTEEFKTKAATIFEAAVVTRVKSELAKLEEQFDTRLQEEVEEIKEGLIEKVDGYLNYVVEQWMSENELALENGMKNEILESFVEGMKGLFEQHYIDIPEEKYDVLGDLQEQIQTAESMLNEQLEANITLSKELNEMKRASATAEVSAGMVATDAEKFAALAEELIFEDVESFKQKLHTIKENYFGKKQIVVAESLNSVVTDEVPTQLNEEVNVSPTMARYLRAFNGTK